MEKKNQQHTGQAVPRKIIEKGTKLIPLTLLFLM
jgi:hypothetical protein